MYRHCPPHPLSAGVPGFEDVAFGAHPVSDPWEERNNDELYNFTFIDPKSKPDSRAREGFDMPGHNN